MRRKKFEFYFWRLFLKKKKGICKYQKKYSLLKKMKTLPQQQQVFQWTTWSLVSAVCKHFQGAKSGSPRWQEGMRWWWWFPIKEERQGYFPTGNGWEGKTLCHTVQWTTTTTHGQVFPRARAQLNIEIYCVATNLGFTGPPPWVDIAPNVLSRGQDDHWWQKYSGIYNNILP